MSSKTVSHILLQIGIDESTSRVAAKATSLISQISPLVSQNAIPAVPALAVEIACQKLDVDCNQTVLRRISGIKPAEYAQEIAKLQRSLNLSQKVSFQELSIRFGCSTDIVDNCRSILLALRDSWGASLNAAMRNSVQWDSPGITAAIFLFCAQIMGIHLKKSSLLALTGSNVSEVRQIMKLLESNCKDFRELTGIEEKKTKLRISNPSSIQVNIVSNSQGPADRCKITRQPKESELQSNQDESYKMIEASKEMNVSRRVPRTTLRAQASGICSMIASSAFDGSRYVAYQQWKQLMLNSR